MVRKHGLDGALHGDYRREPFHCEPALQSLQEIEGENAAGERGTPGSPDDSPTPTPTPTHGPGDDLILKPSRRLGRQESPLSRDTILTGKEKATSETLKLDPQSTTKADTKTSVSKEPSAASQHTDSPAVKAKEASAVKPLPNQAAHTPVATTPKVSASFQSPVFSSSSTVATSSSLTAKCLEKGPLTPSAPSPRASVQEQGQQTGQKVATSGSLAQILDKGKALGQTQADKGTASKTATPEATKAGKGSETVGKNGPGLKEGTGIVEKQSDAKAKALGSSATDPGPAVVKPKEGKTSGPFVSHRGAREEKRFLEVVEEHPASPSPTAVSPSSSKSRAASPGDKASFVTQLTSVAKTVLGPMKLGSQDGGKAKDGSPKTTEEKRGGSSGKSEASLGSRRGATGTWPGPGSSKSDKAKSSKNH